MEKRKTERERGMLAFYESMDFAVGQAIYVQYSMVPIQEEIKSIAGKNSDPFVGTNHGICNVSAVCALLKYCIMHTTCA
jgi:hypothetical protein